jgi:hypothetical protein
VDTLTWLVLGLAWILTLVPFLYARRRVDRTQWPLWERVLDGEGASHFAYLRDLFDDESQAIVDGVGLAEAHLARGRRERAHVCLGTSLHALDECSLAARERVREWWLECRAAASLVPVPALARHTLRAAWLRRLVALHRVAHLVPVTAAERFRLRLRVLDRAFGFLARAATHLGLDLGRRPETIDAPSTWTQAHDLAHDFRGVAHATLDSLHALLASAQSAISDPKAD